MWHPPDHISQIYVELEQLRKENHELRKENHESRMEVEAYMKKSIAKDAEIAERDSDIVRLKEQLNRFKEEAQQSRSAIGSLKKKLGHNRETLQSQLSKLQPNEQISLVRQEFDQMLPEDRRPIIETLLGSMDANGKCSFINRHLMPMSPTERWPAIKDTALHGMTTQQRWDIISNAYSDERSCIRDLLRDMDKQSKHDILRLLSDAGKRDDLCWWALKDWHVAERFIRAHEHDILQLLNVAGKREQLCWLALKDWHVAERFIREHEDDIMQLLVAGNREKLCWWALKDWHVAERFIREQFPLLKHQQAENMLITCILRQAPTKMLEVYDEYGAHLKPQQSEEWFRRLYGSDVLVERLLLTLTQRDRDNVLRRNLPFDGAKVGMCVVCLVAAAAATLIHGDTGHMICCMACAAELRARQQPCPVCKQPVTKIVQNFGCHSEDTNKATHAEARKMGTAVAEQKEGFPEVVLWDDDGTKVGQQIKNGAVVDILAQMEDMLKVKCADKVGWAKTSNFKDICFEEPYSKDIHYEDHYEQMKKVLGEDPAPKTILRTRDQAIMTFDEFVSVEGPALKALFPMQIRLTTFESGSGVGNVKTNKKDKRWQRWQECRPAVR